LILAYVDPGSGSLVLQAIVAGVAGVVVAVGAFVRKWKTRIEERSKQDE
jgi:multisubunit Na+/H+ antiporter MnhC subunit